MELGLLLMSIGFGWVKKRNLSITEVHSSIVGCFDIKRTTLIHVTINSDSGSNIYKE